MKGKRLKDAEWALPARSRVFLAALALAAAFWAVADAACPASAQTGTGKSDYGEVIDRVIAVVEDRAILESELAMEYKRLLMSSGRETLPADQEKEQNHYEQNYSEH